MSPRRIALVAAHRLYESRQRYPDNSLIAAMCDDMFSDLVPVGSFNGLGLSYGMLKSVDGVIVSKGVGFKAEAVAIFFEQ